MKHQIINKVFRIIKSIKKPFKVKYSKKYMLKSNWKEIIKTYNLTMFMRFKPLLVILNIDPPK